MNKNLPVQENTTKFFIDGPLEEFIKSQTYFYNGFAHVYVGGWRFERSNDDPAHIYRLPSDAMVANIKTYYRSELADSFKDMFDLWCIDTNNGYKNTYHLFKIDKDFKGYDWKKFLYEKVSWNRISGTSHIDFQKALQQNNIPFLYYYSLDQEKWQELKSKDKTTLTFVGGNY